MTTLTAPVEGLQELILAADFSNEERLTLSALLSPETAIEVVVPDNTPPEQLWSQLAVLIKTYTRLRAGIGRIKPLIGRVLQLLQKHPEVWARRGFRSWDDFMSRGLPGDLGISRAELYHTKAVADTLPGLELGTAEKLGFTKLSRVAQAVKHDPQKKDFWLQRAEQVDVKQLTEEIAHAKCVEPGDMEMDTLTIVVPKTVKKRMLTFLADPDVQRFVESESPGTILGRLMDECELEWKTRVRESIQ